MFFLTFSQPRSCLLNQFSLPISLFILRKEKKAQQLCFAGCTSAVAVETVAGKARAVSGREGSAPTFAYYQNQNKISQISQQSDVQAGQQPEVCLF